MHYVAARNGRSSVLIELSEAYIPLIHQRLEEAEGPLFLAPAQAPARAQQPSLFPEEN